MKKFIFILIVIFGICSSSCSYKYEYYSDGTVKHIQSKVFGLTIDDTQYIYENKK
jgi:hypothetical protein